MENNPFPDLKINDFSFLDSTEKRGSCQKCNRSRKYYCYTCYKPVNDFIAERIPKVKLPVKIDIIKHPSEVDGKSTSPHAAILAPEDITIYEYPCIPTYDMSKTILIFPGPKSCDLEYILGLKKCTQKRDTDPKRGAKRNHETAFKNETPCGDKRNKCEKSESENLIETTEIQDKTPRSENHKNHANEENSQSESSNSNCREKETGELPNEGVHCFTKVTPWFDKVVFIDSTWNQTPTIANDERLKDIIRVELKLRKTKFWRTQDGNPDEYLSTIEAIYYFLTDFHRLCISPVYKNDYDNLLFFFCFTYNKIRQASGGGNTIKAYSKKVKGKI